MKKRIALDIASLWVLTLVGFWLSFDKTDTGATEMDVGFFIGALFATVLAMLRTVKWLRIGLDVLIHRPKSLLTRGWSHSITDNIYFLDITKRHYYLTVLFDDPRLPGRYTYLENRPFNNGNLLRITYYPRSKYIKTIEKIEDSLSKVTEPELCQ